MSDVYRLIAIVILVACAVVLAACAFHAGLQIIPMIMAGGVRRGSSEQNNKVSSPRTYRLDSEWIPGEVWEKYLPGWTQSTDMFADMTYADSVGYSDKKLYGVHAKLKYRLDCRDLMDKARLHRILAKEAPDTICRTIETDERTVLPPGTWMIRLNTSTGGKNAVAVNSQKEFDKLRKQWKPKTKYERQNSVIMASEYITNPLLHHSRKFHIRLYMVVGIMDASEGTDAKHSWLINEGLIIPAKLPYVAGDWKNSGVHDTHAKNNPLLESITPVSHPDWFGKCRELMSRVMRVMLSKLSKYDEGTAGYEFFGVDIMLTNGTQGVPTAKLIEVNSLPDISKNSPALNDMICRGLVASAIHEVFPEDTQSADPSVITKL